MNRDVVCYHREYHRLKIVQDSRQMEPTITCQDCDFRAPVSDYSISSGEYYDHHTILGMVLKTYTADIRNDKAQQKKLKELSQKNAKQHKKRRLLIAKQRLNRKLYRRR
jgi:hypothetical protein